MMLLAGDAPHLGPIALDATFIALMALIMFIGVLIYVGLPKIIAKTLDDRGAAIKSELDAASALRAEAEALLASVEAKRIAAEAEAAAIVTAAQEQAVQLTADAKAALADQVTRRTKLAEQRIARAEEQATADIRAAATEAAIAAATQLLSVKIDDGVRASLFTQDVAAVERRLS